MQRNDALRAAFGLALAGAWCATPAAALESHDTSAGGACHAANGTLSGSFTRNLHYLTNISNTAAIVVCHLQMDDDDGGGAQSPFWLVVHVAGKPLTEVTCTFQLGGFHDGVNHVYSSQSMTMAFPSANPYGRFDFDYTKFVRPNYHTILSLNCKVPAGGKIGLIEWWE
jgi:hypothetical protein